MATLPQVTTLFYGGNNIMKLWKKVVFTIVPVIMIIVFSTIVFSRTFSDKGENEINFQDKNFEKRISN